MIPFLLHHANRAIKDVVHGKEEFYKIKDQLLKNGKHMNYDVQHIPGKKCYTCGGSGIYTGYYMMSGQQWQDTCHHCWRGWFKMPVFICLDRIKYGRYYFHRPLKREQSIHNPFTKEELGLEVSDRPVISGYIDHNISVLGRPSLLILFYLYDRPTYIRVKSEVLRQMRWEWKWIWVGVKKKFSWRTYIAKPKTHIHQLDLNGEVIDDDIF